ncbi:525_t:CDS:1 [Diversispora eburnea]|uniref:525_t:CDS:1 n=1 Tax=Diversispora eburnea TaxID=1213867 RepID=A0A9N8YHU4_9GLOM|nr:525_t:CDS:1 [Diversispora eburnea]
MDNIDSSCICGICSRRLFDANALYCSSDCANKDSSTSSNSMKQPFQSNLMPSSPPSNLRFSIAITPNIYHASENNNSNVFSNPASLSSSFSDSDYSEYSTSSFTSIYNFDSDYKGFRGYNSYNDFNSEYNLNYEFDDYQSTQNIKDDDDYYPSIYSTSAPIDIPRPRNKDNDNNEPVNKGTFGEKSIF